MAGYPLDANIVNSRAGYLVKTLGDTLDGVEVLNKLLTDNPDDDTLGVGMDPADTALIRPVFAALDRLRRIAHGQETQPEASDFFWGAGKLTALD